MEGAAVEGVPMVKLRGGDGAEFSVQPWRLAELASGDIYDIVQDYRIIVKRFTNSAGELLPGNLIVQAIFAARVQDLDTLGHLTRAAIGLDMKDLIDECYKRMLEDHQMGPQEVEQFLQNAPGYL
uniref:SKP1 component POZ domain-containing protein n=1 Tax=Oryza punctata TaxID=4537 RepID=A0A0E0MP90_ORYPU